MAGERNANNLKKRVGVIEADEEMLNSYIRYISHWGHQVVLAASSAEEAEVKLEQIAKKVGMDVAVIDLAPHPELVDEDEIEENKETDRAVRAVRRTFALARIIVIRSIEDVGRGVNLTLDKMDLAGLREGIEQPLPPVPELP